MNQLKNWNTAEELIKLLPKSLPFKLNGSIDRYGFKSFLANYCGYKTPPRTFAEWIHGWIWDENPDSESLMFKNISKDVQIIVRNESERRSLAEEGYKKVSAGGLPFGYINQQHQNRNPDALLCFPPHSAEVEKLHSNQTDYLDFLESIKYSFDGIYISIHYLDWNSSLHREAIKRGLQVIQGARPDDVNSLQRIRALLDAFTNVTSNTMGSHFVYALSSGCKYSICGPLFTYDEKTLLSNGNSFNHQKKYIEKLISIQQPDYLKKRFGKFMTNSPKEGVYDYEFGFQQIAIDSKLEREDIKKLLGWTFLGKLSGYSNGIKRRTKKILFQS